MCAEVEKSQNLKFEVIAVDAFDSNPPLCQAKFPPGTFLGIHWTLLIRRTLQHCFGSGLVGL